MSLYRRLCTSSIGIDTERRKHVLGMRQGATEDTTVVRELIADLIERGLNAEVARLIVIDGGAGLRRAISECFGDKVMVQRCQVHKLRNVREHLPEALHASVKKAMSDAWTCTDAELAKRQLERLARSLERSHPSAARSIREGLDETLTLSRLGAWTGAVPNAQNHQRNREPQRAHGGVPAQRQALA